MGSNIVWQNTQIPGFSGALNAANKSVSNFGDIVKGFKQGLLDAKDRKIAAEDRAFKRKDDLLQRDLTNQQIAQGEYEAGNWDADRQMVEDKHKLAQEMGQADLYDTTQTSKRNELKFKQTQQTRNDTVELNRVIQRIRSENPNILERDLRIKANNYMANSGRDFDIGAVNTVFDNVKNKYIPTGAEAVVSEYDKTTAKNKHELAKIEAENKGKVDAAIVKAKAKGEAGKGSGGTRGLNSSQITNMGKGIHPDALPFTNDADKTTAQRQFSLFQGSQIPTFKIMEKFASYGANGEELTDEDYEDLLAWKDANEQAYAQDSYLTNKQIKANMDKGNK